MVAELFDLLPQMNACLLPQLTVLGSGLFHLLSGEKQVGLLAGGGDLPPAVLILVALGGLSGPGLIDAFAQARADRRASWRRRLRGQPQRR
ncbi:hypothetical protein [Streptomyces sp. NPDC048224]|uniref:hypothetical protein n=1 Tax=Streptomyces sp. NPDC048224 TaxID=3154500 RepID=UPI0033DAB8D4